MNKRRVTALLLAMIMCCVTICGCGSQKETTSSDTISSEAASSEVASSEAAVSEDASSETEASEEKEVVFEDDDVLVVYTNNKTLNDETINLTWMQEELGFRIKYVNTAGSEYYTNLALAITSGETPDLFTVDETRYLQYVEEGIVMDIEELLQEYAPNVLAERSKEDLDLTRYYNDGKLYAVANLVNWGKSMFYIRTDWLDNLGLDIPETLEEFEEVMYAFTYDDPDGNGIDDTYGYTGNGGIDSTFLHFFPAFGSLGTQWVMKDDGTVGYGLVQEETKECLKWLQKLFQDGVIDPEFLSQQLADRRAKIDDDKVGMWCENYSYGDYVHNLQYADYGMEFTCIGAPVDENGNGGYIITSPVSGYTCISATSKHPDRAAKLLNFLADYENYDRIRTGVEGIHWVYDENGERDSDTEARRENPNLSADWGIAPTYAMPFQFDDWLQYKNPTEVLLYQYQQLRDSMMVIPATYSTAPEIGDQMLGVGFKDAAKNYCITMIMEDVDIDTVFEEMKNDMYDNYDLNAIEQWQTIHYYRTKANIK